MFDVHLLKGRIPYSKFDVGRSMFDVHLLKGRIPYSKFDVYPPSAAPEATRVGRSTCPQRFACEADGCSMFIPFDTIDKLFLSTVPHSSIIQLFTNTSKLIAQNFFCQHQGFLPGADFIRQPFFLNDF